MQPLKLNHLNDEERQILKLVVEEYYAVLPPALQVHSLFATHILSHTLHRFGIRTRVLPCRLWCSSVQPPVPRNRETVRGVVNYWNIEKWNGHVVCIVGDWLVDAALYHLNPSFNYEVPKIIARRIVRPEPGMYTRYQLNRNTEFIWYRLPPKVAAVSVAGYEDFIDRFVDDLYKHIRRLLGYEDEAPGDQPEEAEITALTEEEILAEADAEQIQGEGELLPIVSSGDEAGDKSETSADDEVTPPVDGESADGRQTIQPGGDASDALDYSDSDGAVVSAELSEKTEEPETAPA